MYSKKVMEHFMNPHNVGEIENADGVGRVGNSKCGDIMEMYLKIEDNVITDAKFRTFGCGAAVATSSMATDIVKGKTIDEALKITDKVVADALDGLPPNKMHCSNLAHKAVKAAIDDYMIKKGLLTEKQKNTASSCARSDDDEIDHSNNLCGGRCNDVNEKLNKE